jgi:hypothetical protein
MCGCNGGSGAWTTTSAPSGAWNGGTAQVDGPWLVQLPIYELVGDKSKVTGFETVEVATYGEADALVRQRDPATGRVRGGGIRRKQFAA